MQTISSLRQTSTVSHAWSLEEQTLNVSGVNSKGTYLFIIPWDITHPGGVNQAVINLYRELERSGPLRPLILVLDWHSTSPVEEMIKGCRTVRLRVRQPAGTDVRVRDLASYLFCLPATLGSLRKLVAQYDIRVINAHYPTLGFLNFVILKKLRLFKGPLLVSFHGLDVRSARETSGLVRFLWRWLARSADAIVTVSDSLATEVRWLAPNLTGPPVKVQNGVNAQTLMEDKALASAIGQQLPQRRYLLNVATFEYKKAQDVLLKAFARLAKDIPDVDLVILGGNGHAWQEINNLVVAADLQQRVICIRDVPHPEVLAYMERASVFVLPSRAEGLPIAMLEAGVFGVPVVASRVDGIPEVINSEEVGILVECEDDQALEVALRKLLNNEVLRVALGRQLQKRVLTEFTWQKAWEKYSALIGGREISPRGTPSHVVDGIGNPR
jgi:glycosyltransferase involved in cell wall biosynthesis